MVAHMNAEALKKDAWQKGQAWYFSRSRNSWWAQSRTRATGHVQKVVEIRHRLRPGRGLAAGRAHPARLRHTGRPSLLLSVRRRRRDMTFVEN